MLNQIHSILLLVFISLLVSNCSGQENKSTNLQIVGGGCEGCEAIFEYGDKILTPIDTLPNFQESTPQLKITGTVYQRDGKTPAANVILYIYHTNREGIYETKGDELGWAKRHGYIRGWIKTGKDGQYTFYTFQPSAYPNRREAEHIHITVKEPSKNEYYIDNYVFENDPLLKKTDISSFKNRGGSGIMKLKEENGILKIERNIILGLNIPNYE